jgi:hypothetical protein
VNAPTNHPLEVPSVKAYVAPLSFEETRERAPDDAPPPSRKDLLERAASLGPARMTWESIILPSDPILKTKMQPHIAERRARFRKVVQAAVGACVAFCFVATAESVFSSAEHSVASSIKNAPATGVVPIEKLDIAARTKAGSKSVALKLAKRR